jgi:hypothetical protein
MDAHDGGLIMIKEALADKADPFAITPWMAMVKTVEGNDKFMKVLAFEY